MRINAAVDGSISKALDTAKIKAIMAATKAITIAGNRLKEELRDQVRAAGFSDRLAKSWRGKVYPNKGMNVAAYVYSAAPNIIDAYARGATAVATGGRRYMALPTEDTPMKRSGGRQQQGRAMSPAEVEAKFGAKLRFVPAKSSQGLRIGFRAAGFLVIDNVVAKKSNNRYRPASPRERARAKGVAAGRVESVVMFVLVRSVKFPKLFDLEATAESVASTVPALIAEAL